MRNLINLISTDTRAISSMVIEIYDFATYDNLCEQDLTDRKNDKMLHNVIFVKCTLLRPNVKCAPRQTGTGKKTSFTWFTYCSLLRQILLN